MKDHQYPPPPWNAEQIDQFLKNEFPESFMGAVDCKPERITLPGDDPKTPDKCGMLLAVTLRDAAYRPGGVVSGPTTMTIADFAGYLLILAREGSAARQAVTTSLHCDFLRQSSARRVYCLVDAVKYGRTLITFAERFYDHDPEKPFAQAQTSYFNAAYALKTQPR